jgi:hypothetical protein
VDTAGFLGDYSMLREGEGKEAQLVYLNPGADFSGYDAIMNRLLLQLPSCGCAPH